jgi:hypothetical protein
MDFEVDRAASRPLAPAQALEPLIASLIATETAVVALHADVIDRNPLHVFRRRDYPGYATRSEQQLAQLATISAALDRYRCEPRPDNERYMIEDLCSFIPALSLYAEALHALAEARLHSSRGAGLPGLIRRALLRAARSAQQEYRIQRLLSSVTIGRRSLARRAPAAGL